MGSPLAPYEYQRLKFRASCCSLGPPGKIFFPGSGLTQTPSLTKGEGSQGHWVSSKLGLNLAPSLLGLHCPVSARILLSHFVKNPSTPDIWSPSISDQIPHPLPCLVPLACLQEESYWAGLTRIPHLSPLLQSSTGPLTLGLSVNPNSLSLVKSWYPMPQWPQLRQHPVAHGPSLYASEHAWPSSLQASIVLVCLLACFYCSLLDSGLYHQTTKHRLWAGIFLPRSHELIWPALRSANICGSLKTLLHHLLTKKSKLMWLWGVLSHYLVWHPSWSQSPSANSRQMHFMLFKTVWCAVVNKTYTGLYSVGSLWDLFRVISLLLKPPSYQHDLLKSSSAALDSPLPSPGGQSFFPKQARAPELCPSLPPSFKQV